MPFGWKLSATYQRSDEAGNVHQFVYTENDADISPYDPLKNCAADVLNGVPTEKGHGPMVELNLIGPEITYTFDWSELPADTQPIYQRRMHQQIVQGGSEDTDSGPYVSRHTVGYRYTDEHGSHITHLVEIDDQPSPEDPKPAGQP